MDIELPSIAVVQGATGEAIQALFARFVDRWATRARIVGLIEEPSATGDDSQLRSLADDSRYRLFQDLGAGSAACGLDTGELVRAGEAVRGDVVAGCDLVILSKFGKLEAENRSGLIAAFSAAVEMQVPIVTSVAPRHADAWARFADPLSVILPADMQALEDWWMAVAPRTVAARMAAQTG
ncbi:MAG TPA: DUF2478 domain-containing protein [Sphingobium sp.]|uniref:DUF2478 domain-containing protein n=1 Tax=Sphingobium sp. TaxID=1912891 RepID=UPI002ED2BEC3